MNQTERRAVLAQQDHKCALCADPHTATAGMCYAPDQNVLICRPCSTYLHSYRAAAMRGVTPEALIAFLERKPAPGPTPKTGAEKLTPNQLEGLQYVLNGQSDLSMAEWCRRAGVTEAEAEQQIADR